MTAQLRLMMALKEMDKAFLYAREALEELNGDSPIWDIFADGYPFNMSFDEMQTEFSEWVEKVVEELKKMDKGE